MKLSEAILLGSTVLAPKAGKQHDSELNAGCALGMAAIANGCTFRTVTEPFDEKDRRTLGTEAIWGSWVLTAVSRPCACWRIRVPRQMRVKDIIAHLFDHHIMAKGDWTLEQLAGWVRTVEPEELIRQGSKYANHAAEMRCSGQLVPEPEIEASQREIAEWQLVRRALATKSDREQKRDRLRP